MSNVKNTGRVTIPTDLDVVPQTLEIMKKWGADAIRDCDGTPFLHDFQSLGDHIQVGGNGYTSGVFHIAHFILSSS